MPDDDPIMTDALMKALVADKAGFSYLAKTLQVLLQTLLQDAIAEVTNRFCLCSQTKRNFRVGTFLVDCVCYFDGGGRKLGFL